MYKTYWYLPLDSYNQPSGQVQEIVMTIEEYNEAIRNDLIPYLFDNYEQALRRALD